MLDELTELMRIDVSSGQETEIAEHLVKKLEQMGFAITRDEAGATFGGVCGNILAVREGERDGVVCFCSHMDRVPGGIGIKPVEEDGILRSSGDTILAADDLSGVAAILEGVRQAIESGKALPKLEILFTVGEEAGLYGAKAFDVSLLTSKTMYVLDSPGRIGRIVNGAPGRALLEAQVFGKAAHAGNEPEKGIDAAKIMAEMLATMETGRLDENTTSNFSHLCSTTSCTCSTLGTVPSNCRSILSFTCWAMFEAIAMSTPPTELAALKMARVILLTSKASTRSSRLRICATMYTFQVLGSRDTIQT
jgi:tripeptide aminopeptidase